MAVRFLPPPAEGHSAPLSGDRENLAEVIELRSRLQPSAADAGRPDKTQPVRPQAAAQPRAIVQIAQLRAHTEAIQAAHGPGDSPEQYWRSERSESHARSKWYEPQADDAETAPDYGVASTASHARTATEDAVRLLARKARSSGELRRELLALGHDHGETDETVLECESRLYLDDLGLARVLAETLRARKRASRSQIRLKLRERLLPDGVIETALGELDDDEEHELLRAAASERARKMGGLDRQTAERRLLGFLARRGWSGERAVRVAREALDRSELRGSVRGPAAGSGSVRFR